MKENTVNAICPRDHVFELTLGEVRTAVRHMKETGGKALVGCKRCGTVGALPGDMPNGEVELERYVVEKAENDDPLPCLELEGIVAVEPTGYKEEPPGSGIYMWQPGNGESGLERRDYMLKYAFDPQIVYKLMHQGWKPRE